MRLHKIGSQLRHLIFGHLSSPPTSSPSPSPSAPAGSAAAPGLEVHSVRFLHKRVELLVAVDTAFGCDLLARQLRFAFLVIHLEQNINT